MWSPLQIFGDLLPSCGGCRASYDVRLHAPQTLPCNHTFCFTCLSNEKQQKLKKCLQCRTKYHKFNANFPMIDIIGRVIKRKAELDSLSARCDECDIRRPVSVMRRCFTCEQKINEHLSGDFTMECVVCLECCVNRHNGHQIVNNHTSDSSFNAIHNNPRACSTPRLGISSGCNSPRKRLSSSKTQLDSSRVRIARRERINLSFAMPRIDPLHGNIVGHGAGIICEESPVYGTSNNDDSRAALEGNNWVSRFAGIARRFGSNTSSDSPDGRTELMKDDSSGLGSEDSNMIDVSNYALMTQDSLGSTIKSGLSVSSYMNGGGRRTDSIPEESAFMSPLFYVNLNPSAAAQPGNDIASRSYEYIST